MKYIAVILLMIVPSVTLAEGTVIDTTIFSNSLGEFRGVTVYLPEGYDPYGQIDYPVIYWLHGIGGNQHSNSYIITILDTLIGNQTIEPLIFVRAYAGGGFYFRPFYTNSPLNGNFEDYIVSDLVEFIDTNFRTITNREKRCISGYSMGGYGCMKLALKHTELFRAVAAHSGCMDHLVVGPLVRENLLPLYSGPPYNYYYGHDMWTDFAFSIASAFSPNLQNPPTFIDFPLDSLGNIIDSVMVRWHLHDATHLATLLPPNPNLAIYFDCGTLDELELYPTNVAFADSLDSLDIIYEFQSFTGGHTGELYSRVPISLTFLDSVMWDTTSGIIAEQPYSANSYVLHQNYPNPFNPSTTISYEIPINSQITINIYNILGQKVATLFDGMQQPGHHTITWNAIDAPSGIYFAQVQYRNHIKTIKMVLLK